MLLRRVAFPDFCEPCLPTKAPHPPSGDVWLHEIKHDGFRVIPRKDGNRGRSPDWLKSKNPACAAVKREAEEDWSG